MEGFVAVPYFTSDMIFIVKQFKDKFIYRKENREK